MDEAQDTVELLPPGWLARLEGHDFAKREAARLFQSDTTRVIAHDDAYYLQSSRFETLSDATAVDEQARELTRLMNGAARVQTDGYGGVGVDLILQIGEGGKILLRHVFLRAEVKARAYLAATAEVIRDGVVVEEARRLSIEERAVALAQEDEVVARVLRILAGEHTWGPLYHVYDAIAGQVGGTDALRNKGWAPKSELIRFSRTANHPDVSGDAARHGHLDTEPPRDPMSITEAETLIAHLFREWIRSNWPDDRA